MFQCLFAIPVSNVPACPSMARRKGSGCCLVDQEGEKFHLVLRHLHIRSPVTRLPWWLGAREAVLQRHMAVRQGIARRVPVRARVPVCEGVFSAPTTCTLCLPARVCVGARLPVRMAVPLRCVSFDPAALSLVCL